jgi:hypothetical protein
MIHQQSYNFKQIIKLSVRNANTLPYFRLLFEILIFKEKIKHVKQYIYGQEFSYSR